MMTELLMLLSMVFIARASACTSGGAEGPAMMAEAAMLERRSAPRASIHCALRPDRYSGGMELPVTLQAAASAKANDDNSVADMARR